MTPCCCGCGQRAVQLHHCLTQQTLRNAGAADLMRDPRNLVPVAMSCHAAHHNRSRPLSLHALPLSVFSFAAEVLGPEKAHNYLGRTYVGTDLRLERLLPAEVA